MTNLGILSTATREVRRMGSRKMYFAMMVVVPIGIILFFVSLLWSGLPLKVPAAVVDLDHSTLSRRVTRSLNAGELVDICRYEESYADAMAAVRRGDIFGFFVIPENFEKDAINGNTPTLSYYSNLTYFVPGTLAFKGFKTISVVTAGGLVTTKLESLGMPNDMTSQLIQPLNVQQHPIGNPWLNYSIYLSPSFCLGSLALMIMLMAVFSITIEIKDGTSPEWLATARGHITSALVGKFLPHFVVWSVVGQFLLSLLFCWLGFPCGHLWILCVAMELFIIASIAFAVFVCSVVPNPRMAFSLVALLGILSFSFLGFSFPVQSMYGPIAIFSYIMPCRYMLLTYFMAGLNGFPLYYSRIYLAVLLVFPLVATVLLGRLKRALLNPVYVP